MSKDSDDKAYRILLDSNELYPPYCDRMLKLGFGEESIGEMFDAFVIATIDNLGLIANGKSTDFTKCFSHPGGNHEHPNTLLYEWITDACRELNAYGYLMLKSYERVGDVIIMEISKHD